MNGEAYVSLETAKLLKEYGFDEYTNTWYDSNGDFDGTLYRADGMSNDNVEGISVAPTQQMALQWLREKKGIFIRIVPWYQEVENTQKHGLYDEELNGWGYEISDLPTNTMMAESTDQTLYGSYEDAVEGAIQRCFRKED